MTAEELVREAWRRWNAGEREPDPDLFAEDIEVHSVLTQSVFVGYNGIRAWTAEIDDQFERWELEIDGFEAIGTDLVAARGRIKLKGRESGLTMDQPASWLLAVDDGKIARIHNYIGHDAALEAAAQVEEDRS